MVLPSTLYPLPSLVDLHTHSIVSDGTLAPAALVEEAARRGLRVLALTDHDAIDGLADAEAAGARLGVEIIPGVELSSGGGGHEIHILGYFVDRTSARLAATLAAFAAGRRTRIARIVERLGTIGAPVDLDRVFAFAGPGTAGRPHVARALIEAGYAASIGDAFERYLAFGRPGFVPRHRLTAEDAVAIVTDAGGVPVLAHPLTTGDVEGTLARLVPAGLLGLEVFYGEYDPDTRETLRLTADRWSLIPTGGSDFHGPGFKLGRDLGGPFVPMESVERLRDAARLLRLDPKG